ncbi:type II secretion system protein [Jeongeupia naejangsanensis]|uniref:Prepilin-type N-terminal cleavage/methylation domain-containing protein n=1 Tax=Jeongeupia naejangsanensis TaxID=613195 RepID=A0ABS2BK35_9NEIS|nr:prepilin-type N-terminal cleavage/methylation domain-containing protein [Jeongeupia naejangsanensis]MBM3115961.1 prepilin-type N-terminal cleavage/methylation domain-containing protein [Jeongeupia naejangsanensis]
MQQTTRQGGFTLVELAIVLVIVGLILGLAFKGRDLIDGARVKSAQAGANKIQAAINIYFERYGAYPGDGCLTPNATTLAACSPTPPGTGGARNGLISGANESGSFWTMLITGTNILSAAERNTPFGVQWNVALIANVDYLQTAAAIDPRYSCAMDQQFDDGVPTTGNILATNATYNASTDCWSTAASPAGVGAASRVLNVRLLP